ncbi:hypothetical protein Q1695_004620 [Nippostrongylus brasiliensis]|nr:hypothetical protein Q1695_004620 [Nippostrongylus brasiliensis]
MDAAALTLYVINLVLNTAIIVLDLLIIYVVLKSGEIRRQLILHTIFLEMIMDTAVYVNTIVHDVPSYALRRDVFPNRIAASISVLILCVQWFSQLFVLLFLSIFHFIAVFCSSHFRRITSGNIVTVNIVIVAIGISLTVPLYTKYCGFVFNTGGYFWYFDPSKPYNHIYVIFNFALQIACGAVVILADGLIIYKIVRLRASASVGKVSNNQSLVSNRSIGRRKPRISKEMRLAINFLLLSAGFLAMTLCYNLLDGNNVFLDFFIKLTSNLNLSKWAIYCLGSESIRRLLFGLFSRDHKPKNATTISLVMNTRHTPTSIF